MRRYIVYILTLIVLMGCALKDESLKNIKVSDNHRFFVTEDGHPFFWLGDTGWLLFKKLKREDAVKYLDNRKAKGFNVIQVMVLHTVSAVNAYGDSALVKKNTATPKVTEGNSFNDSVQYDFWDHVEYIVDQAAERNIYMALVPVWGSNVKGGLVNATQAKAYATFLAQRFKEKKNIVWLNGGDIQGDIASDVWNTIGETLHEKDKNHLITFHPRGRTQSSTWFQDALWLDFNMFQSGHRRYDQDTSTSELRYGEDNWKYVAVDYAKIPTKPTLDGEPSYEGIPHGLHDETQPRWKDSDVRRYGYWSVFAGACGFTYGDNSVMQMLDPSDTKHAYGAKDFWYDAINDPGAGQMIHLKNLILSRPYFDRIPDQSLVANIGEKYNYLAATRGQDFAFVYTYNGRVMQINMGKIKGDHVKVSWYNPRNGKIEAGTETENMGVMSFDPPGEAHNGNDWVLILDSL